MPLPEHVLTLTGGCSCQSIRYKLSLPALSDRPPHPKTDPSSPLEPVRLPYTFTDQCNDCRKATSSILPAWITVQIDTASASLASPSTPQAQPERWRSGSAIFTGPADKNRETKTPSTDVVKEEDTTLRFYESSPGVWRGFCGRCGTPLTYWSAELPQVMDFALGTLDREFLDSEDLRPERHMWIGPGISWVKGWMEKVDKGAERHVEDDVNVRMRMGA